MSPHPPTSPISGVREALQLLLTALSIITILGGGIMFISLHNSQQDWQNTQQDKRLDKIEEAIRLLQDRWAQFDKKLDRIERAVRK